jgi:hypothetical protein
MKVRGAYEEDSHYYSDDWDRSNNQLWGCSMTHSVYNLTLLRTHSVRIEQPQFFNTQNIRQSVLEVIKSGCQ